MTQQANPLKPAPSSAKKIIIGLLSIAVLSAAGVAATYFNVKKSFEPALHSIAASSNDALKLVNVTTRFSWFNSFVISQWELESGKPLFLSHEIYNLPFIAKVDTEVMESDIPIELTSYISFTGSKTSFNIPTYQIALDEEGQDVISFNSITGSLNMSTDEEISVVFNAKAATLKQSNEDTLKMKDLMVIADGSLKNKEIFTARIELAELYAPDNSIFVNSMLLAVSSSVADDLMTVDYLGTLQKATAKSDAGDVLNLESFAFDSSFSMSSEAYKNISTNADTLNEANRMQTLALALEKGVSFKIKKFSSQYQSNHSQTAEQISLDAEINITLSSDELLLLESNPMLAVNHLKGQFNFDISPSVTSGMIEAMPILAEILAKAQGSKQYPGNQLVTIKLVDSIILVNDERVM